MYVKIALYSNVYKGYKGLYIQNMTKVGTYLKLSMDACQKVDFYLCIINTNGLKRARWGKR